MPSVLVLPQNNSLWIFISSFRLHTLELSLCYWLYVFPFFPVFRVHAVSWSESVFLPFCRRFLSRLRNDLPFFSRHFSTQFSSFRIHLSFTVQCSSCEASDTQIVIEKCLQWKGWGAEKIKKCKEREKEDGIFQEVERRNWKKAIQEAVIWADKNVKTPSHLSSSFRSSLFAAFQRCYCFNPPGKHRDQASFIALPNNMNGTQSFFINIFRRVAWGGPNDDCEAKLWQFEGL